MSNPSVCRGKKERTLHLDGMHDYVIKEKKQKRKEE